MSGTRKELTLAVGFLTRLRLPHVNASDGELARSIRWYPCVGLGIGAALGVIFISLNAAFPPLIAAVLTVGAGVILTGALHEDGLADLADGLGGASNRARSLEIMRDSRIGTYGVLALGLCLPLKVLALAFVPTAFALAGLIAGHTLGRLAMVRLMTRLPYARSEGAASFLAADQPKTDAVAWAAGVLAIALVGILVGIAAAFTAAAVAFAVQTFMVRLLRRRLGGFTGDGLGATEQIIESAVPLAILLWV